jgi:hypothetical protein
LRVLDLLESLERAIPDTTPTPMELMKHKGKTRKRSSKRRRPENSGQAWSWD